MGQARNIRAVALTAGVCLCVAAAAWAVETSGLQPVPRPGTPTPVGAEDAPAADTEVAALSPSSTRAPAPGTRVDQSPWPGARPQNILDGYAFPRALTAAARGDWTEARQLAVQDGPVAADIIDWRRLRAGRGTFPQYIDFLERNPDWPGLRLLRRRGERSIIKGEPPAAIIAYFADEAPQTGIGALRLVEAHAARGDFQRSRAELLEAWRTMPMTENEEAAFLADYGDVLRSSHKTRLDDALWREERAEARRMLKFVEADQKALANARLALQARSGNADALWKAVPESLANDPGLAKDRMRWLVAQRQRADAGDLIIAQSTSAARLGRPEAWAEWRRILARQAMRDGSPRRAYEMASTHFLTEGSDFADLEWLSGFVALRYLERPTQALTHFRRFRSAIFTPISLGRAGYWEGRALEAMGDSEAAAIAYRDAAQHQTSFYGLLAAEKVDVPMNPALSGRDGPVPWQSTSFADGSVFQAAQLFARAGPRYQFEVVRFLRHLAEIVPEDELVALGDYTLELDDAYVSVRVAKQIAREGAVAHRAYYPVTDLGPETLPVEEALALAIARRESEFSPTVVSPAGARGLMQLMPGTAREMSRKLRLPYAQSRLTTDQVYNAQLGSAYLEELISEFGNNITLVSVGYNAGPGRARSWTSRFGDPRRADVDVVDWIEHIPFNETRNYVMRVAESLPVYRARLSGETAPIRLTDELKGR